MNKISKSVNVVNTVGATSIPPAKSIFQAKKIVASVTSVKEIR